MPKKQKETSPLQVALAARRLDTALAGLHLEIAGIMGMTPQEVLALEHLGMDGPLGPTELGQRLHMTTGAVTALLDRLADHEFIRREPHPHDRRRLLVQITRAGADAAMAHLRPMAGDVAAMAAALSADDRAVVARFLDGMSDIIERHAVR